MASGKQEVIDTLSKACAYGDFEKLQSFVEDEPACLNKPDEGGYFPLQWAALNNRVVEAGYLLQHGAAINQADHTGQTALHWAAVRGSLACMEVLLRHGADPELRDNRGYSVCHVAAQYGQTAVLYHLSLKWNVDVDIPDNDGRTPLHWAAYKGYPDTIRLLLVLNARYTLADREGCTPLHWAAIKGNGEACTVLLQGGSAFVLSHKDVTGSTPAQLAIEKGHRYLGMHLAEYKSRHESSWFGKNGRLSWLSSMQLCPVIWLIGCCLIMLFVHKVMKVPREPMGPVMTAASWSVVLSFAVGMVFLYKTTTADPGCIPTGYGSSGSWGSTSAAKRSGDRSPLDSRMLTDRMGNSKAALLGGSSGSGAGICSSSHHQGLDSPALWAGNWHQLCVSCRIVRPLRAKHCSVTDRCIEVFDHYCPWVGNAIGKGNRHYFLVFLWCILFAMAVAAVVDLVQIQRHVHDADWSTSGLVWMLVFAVIDVFIGISTAALAIAQASQVARNVTTNELANWHRYKYLQGQDGSFWNPFSKGCWQNCTEAFAPHRTAMAPVILQRDGIDSA